MRCKIGEDKSSEVRFGFFFSAFLLGFNKNNDWMIEMGRWRQSTKKSF
jgi:hypothetical protein